MTKLYDVAIVGAGAGGITAALYASRAGLKVALIERGLYGGQLLNTDTVENYTGFTTIDATDLASNMESHIKAQDGIDHIYGSVRKVTKERKVFHVVLNNRIIQSKTVVIATGVKHRKLDVIGEETYSGKGVSYCAVCDGMFFKDKYVTVVGGGDSAAESAIYLSNIAKHVTLIHRRDELRAEKVLQDRMREIDNIAILYSVHTQEIIGDEKKVTGVAYNYAHLRNRPILETDAVFINIGMIPVTDPFKGLNVLDMDGYVNTNSYMETIKPGVFAVGDVRRDSVRQVATAVGDGAIAIDSINEYLRDY